MGPDPQSLPLEVPYEALNESPKRVQACLLMKMTTYCVVKVNVWESYKGANS